MRGDSSADSTSGLSGGFPILGVPCLGVPIIRTILYCVYIGVPLGNYQVDLSLKPEL